MATPSGEWITKELPPHAQQFLKGLPDRHAGDVPGLRKSFMIRRLKKKDNGLGTRKGLEFIPRGKTNTPIDLPAGMVRMVLQDVRMVTLDEAWVIGSGSVRQFGGLELPVLMKIKVPGPPQIVAKTFRQQRQ